MLLFIFGGRTFYRKNKNIENLFSAKNIEILNIENQNIENKKYRI
jgi:hypothetical protein